MMADCYVGGRLIEMPVILKGEESYEAGWITVETDRAFRNPDSTLSTNIFRVWLRRGCLDECNARCTIGSIVIVSGRLESVLNGDEREIRIIGEKFRYIP